MPNKPAASSSHYEIFDDDLHNYILKTDESACNQFVYEVPLCPFCGEVRSSFGYCCQKYAEHVEFSDAKRKKKSKKKSDSQTGSEKDEKGNAKSATGKGKNQLKGDSKEDSKDSRNNNSDARRLAKEHSEQRYLFSISFIITVLVI
jgi:hypothetical protein